MNWRELRDFTALTPLPQARLAVHGLERGEARPARLDQGIQNYHKKLSSRVSGFGYLLAQPGSTTS